MQIDTPKFHAWLAAEKVPACAGMTRGLPGGA